MYEEESRHRQADVLIISFISNNDQLIALYWEIGRIVSEKTATDGWGKSTASVIASYLQSKASLNWFFGKKHLENEAVL